MRPIKEISLEYFEEFRPFFEKMSLLMAENEQGKGTSWKTGCSWAYLMDRLTNQLEDMQNDPDREDYYANIANYCVMLWLRFSEFNENEDNGLGVQ